MKVNMKIDVHHLTRVEGHGNIHVVVEDGRLVDATWAVVETPRFFEGMLRGMSHDMAPIVTSRICGICSIGHTLASLRAAERGLGIEIPKTAQKIRLLIKHGETLQSHFLHLFFLALPDFFNVGSVIPLIHSNRAAVEMALRLRKLANDMCDVVAGRTTHPVSLCVGGISKAPDKRKLRQLKEDISQRIPDLQQTVEIFKTLKIPEFTRETEFVSLKGDSTYPWIGGELVSTVGLLKKEDDYLSMTNEYVVDFSTSKFAKLSRKSFAVGPLARVNNNYAFLKVQDIAEELGLKPVNHNPFMSNVARLIECAHALYESREVLDELLDDDMVDICAEYAVKAGEGVGAVEVPRGILYHHYLIDEKGAIEKANCVIPTTQNNANIHHDLPDLVLQEVAQGKTDVEVTKLCEMLVRSYDPCISCSVH
jgi:coenzyme F420-reducing hydrogenase alpha subunit